MRIARWVGSHPDAAKSGDGADTAETGRVAGSVSEGFVIDDRVVPFPGGGTVAEILAGGLDAARAALAQVDPTAGEPLASIRLLAPVVPVSLRDFVAFEEHVEGVSASVDGASGVVAEWYEYPTFYFTNTHTISGPGDVVATPVTERLDFELEVAVVIGGPGGANLDADAASAAIFGYTIMNDWSARDLQSREMKVRLGPAKGKDFGTTLGPWIVTADELAGYLDDDGFLAVRAEVYVGGELIGEDLVSNAGWPFPEFVMYAARNSRVVAGDVLGSGTVGGGGCLGELWGRAGALTPRPLREGDEVRMVIEGIGELVNTVGAAVAAPPIPPARPRSRARRR